MRACISSNIWAYAKSAEGGFGWSECNERNRIFAVKFFRQKRGIAAGGFCVAKNPEELSLSFPYKFCEADNLSV